MIEAGLVEEVRSLLESGYLRSLPSLSAIGYREIITHLEGEISLEEAIRLIKRSTRILVRRQANWFKDRDPNIQWFRVDPSVVEAMEKEILVWLSQQDE
jgi:tRNA dimethylallyltransferase